MKNFNRNKKAISKDRTAVILEDIKSQFTVFGESLSSVSDKVDKLEAGQGVLNEKVDKLGTKVGVIDERLKNVEVKVDVIDERLKNVEVKVDAIDERLIRVEDDVVEIKHKLSEKVDLEDFKKLEAGHIKLEKVVFQKV